MKMIQWTKNVQILLLIGLWSLLIGCKLELPPEKIYLPCTKPTSLTTTASNEDLKKYTFRIIGGNLADIAYPIVWKNTANWQTLGTSTTETFVYTFTNDGSYKVGAEIKTKCNDALTLSADVVVNTVLTKIRSFAFNETIAIADFTNDGRIVMAKIDGAIKIWDITTARNITSYNIATRVEKIKLTADSKYFFSNNCTNNGLWRVSDGTLFKKYPPSNYCNTAMNSPVASDMSFFITYTDDGKSLTKVEVNTGNKSTAYKLDFGTITHALLTSNDKAIVSSDNLGNVVIFDFTTGMKVMKASTNESMNLLWLDSNNQTLASSGFVQAIGQIYLWNISTAQPITKWSGHSGIINTFAFSADGKYLVSGGQDNKIKIWNIPAGTLYKEATATSPIVKVAFNGSQIYAVTQTDFQVFSLW